MTEPIDYTHAQFTPDTQPIWIESEGQISSFGYYVFCFLFCWLLLPMILALVRYLRVSNHRYELTGQRLREQTGIFFRKSDVLELYRVRDISVDQPLLQRLAGCGRVILQTSDMSTPVVVLEAIPDPLAVADLIRDGVERCRVSKGVREFT